LPLPLVTVALIRGCVVGDGIKLDAVAGCGSCMTLDMLLLELPERYMPLPPALVAVVLILVRLLPELDGAGGHAGGG